MSRVRTVVIQCSLVSESDKKREVEILRSVGEVGTLNAKIWRVRKNAQPLEKHNEQKHTKLNLKDAFDLGKLLSSLVRCSELGWGHLRPFEPHHMNYLLNVLVTLAVKAHPFPKS